MKTSRLFAVALCAMVLALEPVGAATGTAVPQLAAFDTEMNAFMQRWQVPGASLAVVRQGRLVFARGYGVADRSTGELVQPDALFRIASLTKPITATAVMQLVERGLLSLDTAVFPYLARGTPADPRLNRITVRHLLQHSGGWDNGEGADPAFQPQQVVREMGVDSPPDADTLVRWLLKQPLQFDPGTREGETNVDYVLLGEVLAKATGQRYEDAVRTMLLASGTTRIRLGASLPQGRLAGEVVYHMPAGSPLVPSAFSSLPGPVPAPYGGFTLELGAAAGGWVGSAIDLVAFGAALDGAPGRSDLLGAPALAEMMRKPAFAPAGATEWYGLGWNIVGGVHRRAVGDAPGMGAVLVIAADGTIWAALLNLGALDDTTMVDELDQALVRAYLATSSWPATDAFADLHDQGPIAGCYGRPTLLGTQLCLPAVDVPGSGRYTAVLQLTDAARYTFELTGALPALGDSDTTATFDPSLGSLRLPRVLLPMPGAAPAAYQATLDQVPGVPTLQFRLRDAVPLVAGRLGADLPRAGAQSSRPAPPVR
ncbi:serine hydrolase domain-containing protein [Aquabacterium sp.]|uniref:serine hydrolase domain-containing protein n=1 Tax=Aquabacterium sp. TaxID=1872578 RepID=UPI00378486BA